MASSIAAEVLILYVLLNLDNTTMVSSQQTQGENFDLLIWKVW